MIITNPQYLNGVNFPKSVKAHCFTEEKTTLANDLEEESLVVLRLTILKALIQLEIVDLNTLALAPSLKKRIFIPKQRLDSLLKQKITSNLDVETFIKQGYDKIKRLDPKVRSYIRGSTVFASIDPYEFLHELISARVDLKELSNQPLNNLLKLLTSGLQTKPQDLDLLDISICEPELAKKKIEDLLSSHCANTSIVPTERPLYAKPDPYVLFNIDTPTIKIDRLIGTAKTYSLFHKLLISLNTVVNADSHLDKVELVSLEQSPQEALFHYIFNIIQFDYIHFSDFRAVLATLTKLSEGGILIETFHDWSNNRQNYTLENALHHHLLTIQSDCAVLEEALHIIIERTKKHSFDLLSYYLNILIFFKQVAAGNEPFIDRLWINAKNHLYQSLSIQNNLSSFKITILGLLEDPTISLDELLHSLYDLALLSQYFHLGFTTTLSDLGRPLLHFKFDQTTLIFPINTSYFTQSNSKFVFEKYLDTLDFSFRKAVRPQHLIEHDLRINYLHSCKNLHPSQYKLKHFLLSELKSHNPDLHLLNVSTIETAIRKTAASGALEDLQKLFQNSSFRAVLERSDELLSLVSLIVAKKIDESGSLEDLSSIEYTLYFFPMNELAYLYCKILNSGLKHKGEDYFQHWLMHITVNLFSLNLEQNPSIQALLVPELKCFFSSQFFYQLKKLLESKKDQLPDVSADLLEIYFQYNVKSKKSLYKKYKIKNITSEPVLKEKITVYFRGLELNYFQILKPIALYRMLKSIEFCSEISLESFATSKLKRLFERLDALNKRIYIKEYLFAFLHNPNFFLQLLKYSFELAPSEIEYLKTFVLETMQEHSAFERVPQYIVLKRDLLNQKITQIFATGTLRDLEELLENPTSKTLAETCFKLPLIACLIKQIEAANFISELALVEKISSKINLEEKNSIYVKILEKSIFFKTSANFAAWILDLSRKLFTLDLQKDPLIQQLLYPEISLLFYSKFFKETKQMLEVFQPQLRHDPSPLTVTLFLQYNIKANPALNLDFSFNFETEHHFKNSLSDYFRGQKLNYFAPLKSNTLHQIFKSLQTFSFEMFADFCQRRLDSIFAKLTFEDQSRCVQENLFLFNAYPEKFLSLLKVFSAKNEIDLSGFLQTLDLKIWDFEQCLELFELLPASQHSYLAPLLAQLSQKIQGNLYNSFKLVKWIERSHLQNEVYLSEIILSFKETSPALLIPILYLSFSFHSKETLKMLLPMILTIAWSFETIKAVLDQLETVKSSVDERLLAQILAKIIYDLNEQTPISNSHLKLILANKDLLNFTEKLLFLKKLVKYYLRTAPQVASRLFVELFSEVTEKDNLKDIATTLSDQCRDSSFTQEATCESLFLIDTQWPTLCEESTLTHLVSIDKSKIGQMKDLNQFIDNLICFAVIEKLPLIQEILTTATIQTKFSHRLNEFDAALLETFLKKNTPIAKLLPFLDSLKGRKKIESITIILQSYLNDLITQMPDLSTSMRLLSHLCHFMVTPTEKAKAFFTHQLDVKSIHAISDFLPTYLLCQEQGWFLLNRHTLNFHSDLLEKVQGENLAAYLKKFLKVAKITIQNQPEKEHQTYVCQYLKKLDHCAFILKWSREFKSINLRQLCETFLNLYLHQFVEWDPKWILKLLTELQTCLDLNLITHQLLKALIEKNYEDNQRILNLIKQLAFNELTSLTIFFKRLPFGSSLIEQALHTLTTAQEQTTYGAILLNKIDLESVSKQFVLNLLNYPELFFNAQELSFNYYKKFKALAAENALHGHLDKLIHFRKKLGSFSSDWVDLDFDFLTLIFRFHTSEETLFFITTLLELAEMSHNLENIKLKVLSFLKKHALHWTTQEATVAVVSLIENLQHNNATPFSLNEYRDLFIQLIQNAYLIEADRLLKLDKQCGSGYKTLYSSQALLIKTKAFSQRSLAVSFSESKKTLDEFVELYPAIEKLDDSFKEMGKQIQNGLWDNIHEILIHSFFQNPTENYTHTHYFYRFLMFKIDLSLSSNLVIIPLNQPSVGDYFALRKKQIEPAKNIDSIANSYLLQLLALSEKLYKNKQGSSLPFFNLSKFFADYLAKGLLENKIDPHVHMELFAKCTYLTLFFQDVDKTAFNQFKLLFTRIYTALPNTTDKLRTPLAIALLYNSPFITISPSEVAQVEDIFKTSFNPDKGREALCCLDIFSHLVSEIEFKSVESAIKELTECPSPASIGRAISLFLLIFKEYLEKGEKTWKPVLLRLGALFKHLPFRSSHFNHAMNLWFNFLEKDVGENNAAEKSKSFEVLFSILANYFTHYKAKSEGIAYIVKYLDNGLKLKIIDIHQYFDKLKALFEWRLEVGSIEEDPILKILTTNDQYRPQRLKLLNHSIKYLVRSNHPEERELGTLYKKKLTLLKKPLESTFSIQFLLLYIWARFTFYLWGLGKKKIS